MYGKILNKIANIGTVALLGYEVGSNINNENSESVHETSNQNRVHEISNQNQAQNHHNEIVIVAFVLLIIIILALAIKLILKKRAIV